NVFNTHKRNSICLQSSFTGFVKSLGTIRSMELDEPHDPFISNFRVIGRGQYFRHTRDYVRSVGGCFTTKVFRAPLGILPMGTAQMFLIGGIDTFPRVPLMQSNPLMVVVYFYDTFCVMDQGSFSYVPVGYAVIALVRRKVHIAHFLNFCPLVILEFVSGRWQWL